MVMDKPLIIVDDRGWWFWDDTGTERFGPYLSYDEAVMVLKEYILHYYGP